jgi:CRISPR-associated protein Cmx8
MAEDSVTLTYDPFTLPTAQHRAGLAGLLFLTASMQRRGLGPTPSFRWTDEGRCELAVNQQSVQAIFNDLYDARAEEVERKNVLKKAKEKIPPKRQEKRLDGKTGKEKTVYIYDQIVPRAEFLRADRMPESWVKLWRDCIWGTLRGIPTTRKPFKDRSEGEDTSEARAAWRGIVRSVKRVKRGRQHTEEVPSCLLVGSQSVSAEKVPFQGRADENLLLHFWPVVMKVYVPVIINQDGTTSFGHKLKGREIPEYIIAVPDVADVRRFVRDYPAALAKLDSALARYRPRDAVVSVPQEGALEYAMGLARAKHADGEIALNISGVEVFHLVKEGNNIHILAADRVGISKDVLRRYEAFRNVGYRHPLFRRQLILNILRGEPWYAGFDTVFLANPQGHFVIGVADDKLLRSARDFARDVEKRFAIA